VGERIKILITVKTYPTPSSKYDELVCTAGVREDGSFIRLYPINYRYRPYWQWFQKYQWVEVEVERRLQDPRPESFRPIGEIMPLGPPIDTSNNWAKRKQYVFAKGISAMCELPKKGQREASLGIIKPSVVEDFIIEETEREFPEEYLIKMRQMDIFQSDKRKPLEKIPYKFSYKFRCEDPECAGHKQMTTDWELGRLYLRMRDQYQDEKVACDKVRERFYDTICAADKDTHFFVGTTLAYGTWIVIGTFWPKKANNSQQLMFPDILSS
jgi:hypothetical protein